MASLGIQFIVGIRNHQKMAQQLNLAIKRHVGKGQRRLLARRLITEILEIFSDFSKLIGRNAEIIRSDTQNRGIFRFVSLSIRQCDMQQKQKLCCQHRIIGDLLHRTFCTKIMP